MGSAVSVDMDALEGRLVDATRRAVERFGARFPRSKVARLFLDGTPRHAPVGICLDTETNARKTESALEAQALEARRRLSYAHWESAARQAGAAPWQARFEPSEFSHPFFAEVKLAEYAAFAASDRVLPDRPGVEPWATAVLRILFSRALDRLVDDGALDGLLRASPLSLGYALHDEPPVLVRTLR